MSDLGEKPPEEWRWIFEQYDRLRELERPRVLQTLRGLVGWLRYDADTLSADRCVLRQEVARPVPDGTSLVIVVAVRRLCG